MIHNFDKLGITIVQQELDIIGIFAYINMYINMNIKTNSKIVCINISLICIIILIIKFDLNNTQKYILLQWSDFKLLVGIQTI